MKATSRDPINNRYTHRSVFAVVGHSTRQSIRDAVSSINIDAIQAAVYWDVSFIVNFAHYSIYTSVTAKIDSYDIS